MRSKKPVDGPAGDKVKGPVVRNDPKKYRRLGEVSRLFGITASTIRNREADGTIPPVPRNAAGDRLIPVAWIQEWIKSGGFPGPRATDLPLPMPGQEGAPVSIVPAVSRDGGPSVVPDGAPLPDSATPAAGITDAEYRADSNRVQRLKDDTAAIRAEVERRRAQQELDAFDRPAPITSAGDSGAVAALVQQNTELLRIIMGNRGVDPVEQAVRIIGALRAATPDNRDRPESRLYETLAGKLIDRVGDKLFEPNGEGGGPSMFMEVVKALGPIVGDLIRAGTAGKVRERVAINREPEPRGAGNGSGELPAVTRSVIDLAPDPILSGSIPQAINTQPQESGDNMGIIGDVFEMIVNLYAADVSPEDGTQALTQILGPDPHVIVRRLTGAPVTALRLLAIGSGVPQAAALMDTEAGREWIVKVQALLADIYK